MHRLLSAALVLVVLSGCSTSPTTVVLVRHAEKQSGDDPALTDAGRVRAAARLGLDVTVIDDVPRHARHVAETVLRDHHGGVVLTPAPVITSQQYDQVFVVTCRGGGATIIEAKYGERTSAGPR